ncbi:MAG TPA: nucleoside hydrolase [Phycisphaerales bacterium]|nr:nucleoside hydrolase [Phycisphaerales bacterium]HCD31900.1 nucleoside hydrolase [Phycisphaerales bacterium]
MPHDGLGDTGMDNPYAPAMVDAISMFYCNGDIPIGMVQNGVTPEVGQFNRVIVERKTPDGHAQFPTTHPMGDYMPAVILLRRLHAHAQDHSVTLILIGFCTNLYQLLMTPPDNASSLNGKKLLEQKVSHVVMMAGNFTDITCNTPNTHREYNITEDLPASTRFIHECPAQILFSGWEAGAPITYPAHSILNDYKWIDCHTVVKAYKLYKTMPYDRPTYDLAAVLHAVKPDREYFHVSKHGKVHIDYQGITHFSYAPQGNRHLLSVDDVQRKIIRHVQIELFFQPTTQPPQ